MVRLTKDGTPTLRLNEFMLASLAAGRVEFGSPDVRSEGLLEPKELQFEVDTKTKAYIKDAEKNFDDLVGKHELLVSYFYHEETRRSNIILSLGSSL